MTGKFTGRRSQFPRQTSTSVPYPDLEIGGGGGGGGGGGPRAPRGGGGGGGGARSWRSSRPLDKEGGRSLGLKIGGASPGSPLHCASETLIRDCMLSKNPFP